MAKQMPHTTVNVPPKFTSQGERVEDVERREQELDEKRRFMERKINHMIENAFLDNGEFSIRNCY